MSKGAFIGKSLRGRELFSQNIGAALQKFCELFAKTFREPFR
jgi:hypothetical protein